MLKCYKLWKHYLKMLRLKHEEKQQMLQNFVTAIHYHEQCLKTKTHVALYRHKVEQIRIKKAFYLLRNRTVFEHKYQFFVEWRH